MSTATVDDRVTAFVTDPRRMFIDGQWVEAASGKTFATPDPATGETLAQVAEGDATDIDRAVDAARRAFEEGPWSRLTPSERGRLIWRIGDLVLQHADELAQLESLDNGKPYAVARAADVPLAADLFHYMAGWATKIEGNTIDISVPFMPGANFHSYTLREPVGVVGQIIPWNFPLLMAAWKLGPALATGNCVVLKPAEQTPLSALRLAELIAEAGVPEGVVNVVPGYGETAGARLAAHPGVDKVAFTGSTEVGRLIVQAAAGNLKKLTLELGGKSPNIVFEDAEPGAIAGAANAIFFNHGQCCVAGSRLFVHQSRFDEVVEGVAEIARSIKLGPGMDADTQMGPLVSDEQLRRVTGYLESGRADGATTVVGGGRHGDRGYFVEPTVLTGAGADMRIVREEIFGPVVVAAPFQDLDEIAAAANATEYGLGAGIWTKDISKAHALAKKIRAGTVWINCYNVFDAALPFGGYKQSGWGREMGHEALNAYTEVKAVTTQL
ncbi:aldehyde dehydrogenase family protein [Actinomadura xylanilytica]|uniref:aldehyde dehydrogenase family protein n=1 Tax=Actinomadura xylanilytica TaxID=887459 RepID=UPI00255AEB81|nr:aldehyde dehydrogenase family protein [Actinomadura xylanilytica]MDL4775285.1 aldehyde dehydrogenase family protein [Actinomadura xylanilytica]